MPPSHKPDLAPSPGDCEAIELDSELLQSETDRIDLSPPASPAIVGADELPAGLGWHLNRQWARVRPHARSLAHATAATLTVLRKLAARAAAHARPIAHRLGQRLRRRWAERRRWALSEGMWPGWPTSWRRLLILAAGAFGVGALFVLPFALAGRQGPAQPPAPVALERPPATSTPPLAASAPLPPPAPHAVASRAEVARQMAREAFEQYHYQDGVWYFRTARRAQRRAPGDDVLILSTIAALADREAAPAAKRLLRELGGDARAMLAETARSHPDPVVRGHARELTGPPRSRPFLRWVR